jgi:hypothetical protein
VTLIPLLQFAAMKTVHAPAPSLPPDALRYVRDIEEEFNGLPSDKVLLDVGTWVYLDDRVVMKDRAPTIGERGYSQTGDFSGVLQRIRGKEYQKLLIRRLDSQDFWYDHCLWPESSGIRRAILDNYTEEKRIPALASGHEGWTAHSYLFDDVHVMRAKQ